MNIKAPPQYSRGYSITHAITGSGDAVLNIDPASPILERTFPAAPNTRMLILNRPEALHALNKDMCSALYNRLRRYEATEEVKCVILTSEGTPGRAFCAGGDIRSMYNAGQQGKLDDVEELFRSEYGMNSMFGSLKSTSVVSIMDGIVMGGGVGLAIHGKYRVATENTVFAMPECAIGLYPDIGASYFLPRLSSGLGMFLGLTGHRLKGRDVVQAGLATHFVPTASLPGLLQELQSTSIEGDGVIDSLLREFETQIRPEPLSGLNARIVRECFDFTSTDKIVSELKRRVIEGPEDDQEFAASALQKLKTGCPTSVKVACEALKRGASRSLNECLMMEFRLTLRMTRREDFFAGVKSAVVTKDRNPKWNPSSLDAVSDSDVAQIFEPLRVDLDMEELDLSHDIRKGEEFKQQVRSRL